MDRDAEADLYESCLKKKSYRTAEAAGRAAATALNRGSPDRLRIYGPCPYCGGGFHLTKTTLEQVSL